ncbi:phage portal protein [Mycolicibacter algericus]|uniref:Phage portal protein n=2 Tax=Mycolicibacter algericus TaxID=1288388 RepID=A0A7I9Y3Z9_MYCAL|nr:phage portal protein [Mycolicibacter algericus]OQZ96923.1 hypothetical protein BST10_10120 [Mycolicibacter algericus DSM 45454]GFG83381.1 hypothetical protein MALGJ_00570 [Mycolicibacter algericus]
MRLIDQLAGGRVAGTARDMSIDDYAHQLNQFNAGFGYQPYGLQQTLTQQQVELPANTLEAFTRGAFASNGVVFACMAVRQLVFSSVRFQWQRLRDGSPSDTFGNLDLGLLERPWVGGTTQDLLSRMIQDADLAGNSYWVREGPGGGRPSDDMLGASLVRLRPDWVQIVGKPRMMAGGQVSYHKIGYLYWERGVGQGEPVAFRASQVAHFAPIPDPLAEFTGMSWLTPVLREIAADQAMTQHQRNYLTNGATPNIIIKHSPAADRDAIIKWAKELEAGHAGAENAGKTLHLYPGADLTVAGSNFKDMDFDNVRAGGEVRIAAAAGVPPVIVGLSKGLDSATYSNYGQARRRLADGTAHPLWQNMAGSLELIMSPPSPDVRLWYDASGVPFLREDEKDAADIQKTRAETINTLITAGYEPGSVVAAVEANDFRLLNHSGLMSVQLQKPGAQDGSPEGNT